MKLSYIKDRFNQYADYVSRNYKISKIFLFVDFLISNILYNCTIRDYFLYEFYLKRNKAKKQYMTGVDMTDLCDKCNDCKMAKILNDKEEALMYFKDYINREWCGTKYHSSKEELIEFAKKHKKCIVKPLNQCGGKGVHIIDSAELFSGGGYTSCIIEELVEQSSEMSKIYQGAVNTLRIATVNHQIIGAVLRVGRGGAEIDNASSGGIFAEINIDNGIVITDAFGYGINEKYEKHPDSGVYFIGFQIPMWEEAKELVLKAEKLIDGLVMVGYDIAISKNGPVIIEINPDPEISLLQQPRQRGLKYLFNR